MSQAHGLFTALVSTVPKATDFGEIWELLATGNASSSLAVGNIVSAVRPHVHRRESEVYYVMAGRGRVTVGGQTRTLGPGSAVLTPPDVAHFLVPEEPMSILIINVPAFDPTNVEWLEGDRPDVQFSRDTWERELATESAQPSVPPIGRVAAAPDHIAPDGSEIRLLADASHGATHGGLAEVFIPAGAVSQPVAHRTVEELWYVIEGHGHVWRSPPEAELRPVAVREGDALVIPTQWRFQFSASADGPLRFLCVTMPPWPGSAEARELVRGGLGPATLDRGPAS